MMETERIAQLVERVLTGDPWHGPSVRQLLDGIDAGLAAARPAAGAHSIWEIVLHMTGWALEVTARLRGRAAQEPERGDWPAVAAISESRWDADRRALFAAHDHLAATVRTLDPAVLDRPVLDFRDNALGTGLSHYVTLHGIVHHTLYHAGQLALLRRLQA
jgi:hypothetical protein